MTTFRDVIRSGTCIWVECAGLVSVESHNPEVAGVHPAPRPRKALLAQGFLLESDLLVAAMVLGVVLDRLLQNGACFFVSSRRSESMLSGVSAP
jgi:hypothetical protein